MNANIIVLLVLNLTTSSCTLYLDASNIEKVESCVSHLISKLFSSHDTLYFIHKDFNGTYISSKLDNPRIIANINKPVKMELRSYSNYLIYTHENYDLRYTIHKLKLSPVWNVAGDRGNFLIITSDVTNLTTLIETLWAVDIIKVIFIVYGKDNAVPELYGYRPFAKDSWCSDIPKPRFIQHCYDNTSVEFYPVRCLHGCNLVLANSYIVSKSFKETPVSGSLIHLLYVIGDVLNASISFVVTENIHEALYNYSEKIIFTSLYLRLEEAFTNYDVSDLVYQDVSVWAVPKANRISDVKLIASVFSKNVLRTIAITFVIAAIAWWILAQYTADQNNFRTTLNSVLLIFSYTMGSPFSIIPRSSLLRCLALLYIFYSIVIGTSFRAKLISILTNPGYEDGIKTVEQLAEKGFGLISEKSSVEAKLAGQSQKVYNMMKKIVVEEQQLNVSKFLNHVAYYGNSSTVVGKRAFRLYPKERAMVDIIEENTGLLSFETSIAMRKGHYFLEIFNKVSSRLIECGFLEKVLLDAETRAQFIQNENVVMALKVSHLEGVLIWWGVGLVCAFTLFLVEMLISYFCFRSNKRVKYISRNVRKRR